MIGADSLQIRTPEGHSFWLLREQDLSPPGRGFITLFGREWLCKRKDSGASEILGYQLATHLSLPLRPWLSFYTVHEKDNVGLRIREGILVERIVHPKCTTSITSPTVPPELIAKALALAVFDRFEWPEWIFDIRGNPFLFDLERIGPNLGRPPQNTRISWYRDSGTRAFQEARQSASEANVLDEFLKQLAALKSVDWHGIIDFSGHPLGRTVKRVLSHALQERVWELRKLDGEVKPIRRAVTRKPTAKRRQDFKRSIQFRDAGQILEGTIYVKPRRRGTWLVRWDIEKMDHHYLLSEFFLREKFTKAFESIVVNSCAQFPSPYVRWGSAVCNQLKDATELASKLKKLWIEVLEDFQHVCH